MKLNIGLFVYFIFISEFFYKLPHFICNPVMFRQALVNFSNLLSTQHIQEIIIRYHLAIDQWNNVYSDLRLSTTLFRHRHIQPSPSYFSLSLCQSKVPIQRQQLTKKIWETFNEQTNPTLIQKQGVRYHRDYRSMYVWSFPAKIYPNKQKQLEKQSCQQKNRKQQFEIKLQNAGCVVQLRCGWALFRGGPLRCDPGTLRPGRASQRKRGFCWVLEEEWG